MCGVEPRLRLWEGGHVRDHPMYLRKLRMLSKALKPEAVHGVCVLVQLLRRRLIFLALFQFQFVIQ